MTTEDVVNHPRHYTSDPSGVEAITICEHRTFCMGNALKYLFRAGRKGGRDKHIEDLRKAIWYIEREISRLSPAAVDADVDELLSQSPDYDPKTFYAAPGACPDAPISYELAADDADEWSGDKGYDAEFFDAFADRLEAAWCDDDCGAV